MNKLFTSFVFKFFERILVKGLGLIITIILARLIAPEVYGLLAIIMVFINLAQTFVQSGLATALVQNQDTGEEDYSTVFYVSLIVAVLMIPILYITAPIIARVYKSEALINPLRVLSLSLIVGAYNSVQNAKMQREMRFKEMMYCNLSATIISGIIGITAATAGLGIWALVVYHMVQLLVVTVAMQCVDDWHPRLYFSIERAKVLYGFGWKLLVSSLLTSIYFEIRTLIVGYKYSSSALAYYNKGYQFPSIIANTLDVAMQSVMLPVMSREQNRREWLRETLLHTVSISVFAVTPVMLGLAAIANTLIPLLLGDVWRPCIPLLCVFCVAELMLPMQSSNLSLLKAIGRSDLYMKTEVIRRVIMLIILAFTIVCFDSVFAIACGYAVSAWIDAFIITKAVESQIGCSWCQQMKKCLGSLMTGVVMYISVLLVGVVDIHPICLLVVQIVVGMVVYVGIAFLTKNNALILLKNKFLRGTKRI